MNETREVIRVVDTRIFEKELKTAKAVLEFIHSFLSKKKYVAKFLGVSETTITNMVADGRLQEGVHYTRDKKINYIPKGIIDYKINPPTKPTTYKPSAEAQRFI